MIGELFNYLMRYRQRCCAPPADADALARQFKVDAAQTLPQYAVGALREGPRDHNRQVNPIDGAIIVAW